MSGDGEDSSPTASAAADELADRLVERRERLAYFLVTGSTAIIAFTVTQLGETDGPLRTASVTWLALGWSLLLLSAGASLMLIWRRHQSYSLYLDSLYGQPLSQRQRQEAQKSVASWQRLALILFFIGSFAEFGAWAFALWRAAG